MQGQIGRRLLSAFFVLVGMNALVQVVLPLIGRSDDPASLVVLQLLSGSAALAAAVGAWKGTRWAPDASVVYGVVTAAMLVALPHILDFEDEPRFGVYSGAAVILLFSVAAGWYLRRQREVAS